MQEEKPKEIVLNLMPDLLYLPLHFMGYSKPDPNATFNLYDRVVNVRSGISVPLGLKGIIIGKHEDPVVEVNTLYDVLFDEEFPGGVALRCSPGRGYKMSGANLLNLTYGASLAPKKIQKNAIVHAALQPARVHAAIHPARESTSKQTNERKRTKFTSQVNDSNGSQHLKNGIQDMQGQIQILQKSQPKQRINLTPKKKGQKQEQSKNLEVQVQQPKMVTLEELEKGQKRLEPVTVQDIFDSALPKVTDKVMTGTVVAENHGRKTTPSISSLGSSASKTSHPKGLQRRITPGILFSSQASSPASSQISNLSHSTANGSQKSVHVVKKDQIPKFGHSNDVSVKASPLEPAHTPTRSAEFVKKRAVSTKSPSNGEILKKVEDINPLKGVHSPSPMNPPPRPKEKISISVDEILKKAVHVATPRPCKENPVSTLKTNNNIKTPVVSKGLFVPTQVSRSGVKPKGQKEIETTELKQQNEKKTPPKVTPPKPVNSNQVLQKKASSSQMMSVEELEQKLHSTSFNDKTPKIRRSQNKDTKEEDVDRTPTSGKKRLAINL